jgi:hypothetical protein
LRDASKGSGVSGSWSASRLWLGKCACETPVSSFTFRPPAGRWFSDSRAGPKAFRVALQGHRKQNF